MAFTTTIRNTPAPTPGVRRAIGALAALALSCVASAALGQGYLSYTLNDGQTLNYPDDIPVSELSCCTFHMNGGTVRIAEPGTGAAVVLEATDSVLRRGRFNHWYAQTPGTELRLYGDTHAPGDPLNPAANMDFRASVYDSQGMAVRNYGSFFQRDDGQIALAGPVQFVNEASATYYIQNDRGILGGSTASFLNLGAFWKTMGTGTSRIEVGFGQQSGKIETWTGGIDLLGGGSHADSSFYADHLGFNASGGGIGFGGVHTFSGNTLTDTGRFRVIGSGRIDLESGTWNQNARFEALGQININYGATLRNAGNLETIGWSGGRITAGGAGTGNAVFHNAPGGVFKGSLDGGSLAPERLSIFNEGQFTVGVDDGVLAGDFVNSAGVLTVDGSLDNWSGKLQLTGGVLQGTGIINSAVFIGGGPGTAVFKPGHSPGWMTINGAFSLQPNGVLEIEIERDPLTGLIAYDRVSAHSFDLNGSVSFIVGSGIDTADVSGLQFLVCGDYPECFSYGSNFSFDFPGRPGSLLAYGNEGLTITSLAPVPEPETWALMLAGLGLVGAIARRRSRLPAA